MYDLCVVNNNEHKAGFVNIIGKPNVGKSTLMNALVGEKLSIITSKAQTTRHRIFGIVNGDDFQIVFSDSPGVIDPAYQLQKSMMKFVHASFEDADVLLYMTEVGLAGKIHDTIKLKLENTKIPIIVVLNKIDKSTKDKTEEEIKIWEQMPWVQEIHAISALNNLGVTELFTSILEKIPDSPAYYPKDQFTDKNERFFVEEIIREKILLNYKQEIPYSVEVVVEEFKEQEDIIRIRTVIYTSRKSQKPILIGRNGSMLKKVGTEARLDMEKFFGKKIFLETFVKVKENWRDSDRHMKLFGYDN